jgi:D-amino-acid dehydrogenase
MKVLVMGAGVIGVTTSYYLARAGFEVTVIDRQPGPGRETSFANAGEVSPGYASPWAGPGVPAKAMRWMLDQYGPLVVRPSITRSCRVSRARDPIIKPTSGVSN